MPGSVGRTVRNALNARFVKSISRPGYYADGGNLYLQVARQRGGQLTRSWIFRYQGADGRRTEMGLGPYVDVSLARARLKAAEYRALLRDGHDPLLQKRSRRQAAAESRSNAITFKTCCARYIETQAPGWRNPKHKDQWTNTLACYAEPVIGHLRVADIGTEHVLRVLEPIWNSKRETARRLRARIERVLAWAATRGYRSGDNPARWQGNLKHLLASESQSSPVRHHPALPFPQMHAFMGELRTQPGIPARALEFTILTAARTGEVLHATWEEIDRDRRQWTLPGSRMKTGKPHRVPLSEAAIQILEVMEPMNKPFVFPGRKGPLSNMAMLNVLKRLAYAGITVHGFRSTFRDWAAEQTAYPNHVIEMALAHVIGDKVERAYRRGDLLDKRRRLMVAWARYIEQSPGAVVPIRQTI